MLQVLVAFAFSTSFRDCMGISSHEEHIPIELQLRLGTIRGFESIFLHKRVRSFLSVPFAEPPIGRNRFRPPLPKRSWNGTIDTTQLSPACYQARDTYNETFWGSEMWNANTPNKEDCLYVNIWTPAEANNLTVMVWLFGGGYYYGSPSLILYDGKALALTANVIVININYRVGPFGYLYFDHEDAPGNMGMLDQQLALHWIRENVHSFGGNPAHIALFGESAGAASIVAHLVAPASRGLFNNGILQSGTLDNKWSLDSPTRALQKSEALAKRHNCYKKDVAETLTCLRALPAAKLLEGMWLNLEFLEFPFVPVSRDRNFFRQYDGFIALHNGQFNKNVNIMVGINHDEGNFWNIYNMPEYFDKSEQPLLSQEDFLKCVNTAFKTQPEVVRDAAAFVYLDKKCEHGLTKNKYYAEQVNQMVGDYFFTCDSLWLAEQMKGAEGKVYVYYFDQPSSANPWPKWTGVMHAYEIEYVFGVPIYNITAGYTNREKIFSQKIIQYWRNFAAEGVPHLNDNYGEPWPEYHKSNQWMYLRSGSHIKPIERRKQRECAMWRSAKEIEYYKYLRQLRTTSDCAICSYSLVYFMLPFLLIVRFRRS
uniref:Carboxylic ester hydrolase n=1 Tax=Parascaris univalens TaxID=6257 RepID=A0A914ZLM9_PARUN